MYDGPNHALANALDGLLPHAIVASVRIAPQCIAIAFRTELRVECQQNPRAALLPAWGSCQPQFDICSSCLAWPSQCPRGLKLNHASLDVLNGVAVPLCCVCLTKFRFEFAMEVWVRNKCSFHCQMPLRPGSSYLLLPAATAAQRTLLVAPAETDHIQLTMFVRRADDNKVCRGCGVCFGQAMAI